MITPVTSATSNLLMGTSDIGLREQMRAMSAKAGGQISNPTNGGVSPTFKSILDGVATSQNRSADLSKRFITGDKSVGMADVLAASQDSSIKFEALRVSRNKMLEITKEILNTQI